MVVGGITVEDDVFVAANAQSISNNYYLYDHQILTYKPIRLKRNCWIGAGVAYSAKRYGKWKYDSDCRSCRHKRCGG